MLIVDLCRIIIEGYESTEDLTESIRNFMSEVTSKHEDVISRRETSLLSKWNSKLTDIIIHVRNFPTEFQVELGSFYPKVLGRLLAYFVDLNLVVGKKSKDVVEHLSNAFRNVLLMSGDRTMLPNIWLVIINSTIFEEKNSAYLECLLTMAVSRLVSWKSQHSNEQYLRMMVVLNQIAKDTLHPERFEKLAAEAMKVKVVKGFEKYLCHLFPRCGFNMLTMAEAQQRFLTLGPDRPKSTFFKSALHDMQSEDKLKADEKKPMKSRVISTTVTKIGETTPMFIKTIEDIEDELPPTPSPESNDSKSVPNKMKPESTKKAPQQASRPLSKPAPKSRKVKIVNNDNEENDSSSGDRKRKSRSDSVDIERTKDKRKVLKEAQNTGQGDEASSDTEIELVADSKTSPVIKGWKLLWEKFTEVPTINIDRIDLSQFEKVDEQTYIVS
ncbi:hypothetical protein HDE_07142 [Halotydeus destructor]|nr:hypothetical protein HDE_07142 [Halotydeus destructor]